MSLGESLARLDAPAKTTGAAIFAGDLRPAEMLHAKVLFTNEPHAKLLSLDVAKARALEGVVMVLTAADVPVNEYGLTMPDQPVLVGPSVAAEKAPGHPASDISRWEADHLAIVIAESVEICDRAGEQIEVEWEQLGVVPDLDAALAAGGPLVHPENGNESNAYHHIVIRKGDVVEAFADAAIVVEATYELPHQEHAFLQTEVAVGSVDSDGRIMIETAGQWTHEDREQIAHALGLDEDRIRVVYRAIGGAFGGKEDMSLQIVTALAVHCLRSAGITRPVRAQWSREESIVGHHKRHRGRVWTRWAATEDGAILGVEADAYLDAGAYNYTSNKVLGNLHLSVAGPYDIPAARIDSRAVYTNAVPGGAFRGFGGPQGAFVAECQINKVAQACGLDPVEVRRRNLVQDGSVGITGTELPAGVSIRTVVEECMAAAAWDQPLGEQPAVASFASLRPERSATRRGHGLACAAKNVGFSFGFPERSEAKIILHGAGAAPTSAELFLAGADVGQGAHTAFMQLAAEATGLDVDSIVPVFSDTATAGDSGSASASRLSWMTGNALLGAAAEAKKAWDAGDRPAVGSFKYVPPPTEMLDPLGAPTQPNFAYGYVAEAVDLSVDIQTGHITVHDVVCAVDVGRVINPALAVGQVEGAVVQAHGYVFSENLIVEAGRIQNPRLSGYLIPGIGDIPERVRSVLVEVPDPLGPFGVRGMAEMPLIPYAPAVVAALHDATGVWFDEFPLTPPRVQAKLKEAGCV